MEVQLSTHQINLIKKIAKEEGFTDYELKTTPGSSKGDNYMGIITAVTVWNDQKRLELILKASLDPGGLTEKFPVRKIFLNEIFIYKSVLPQFKQFEEDQGRLDGFSAYAKLYGTSDEDDDSNEFLVFENLKTKGYELWNRRVPMTAHHVSRVLEEYGKLHAVSFAMRKKRPEDFEALHKNLNNILQELDAEEVSGVIKSALGNGFAAVKGDQSATKAFERFTVGLETFLWVDANETDENSVILHGDCWCNNIMFKYEDPKKEKPSKVRLLDWQLTRLASPALDLSYFLVTCSSKEILADYKHYLRIYHDTLRDSLKELHYDLDDFFPFTLLLNHWQKYVKHGIYMALNLFRMSLIEEHEVPDMAEPGEETKSLADTLRVEITHSATYNQRVLDLDNKKKPSKVCFIDWQISWVNSLVIDLSYFLLTSAAKEDLSHYKKYLKIYHDSLSESLRKLHCDPETLFPFAILEEHWQKYSTYGVYMALTLLKLMLSDGNEVPDMSEIADAGKNFAEGFNFDTVHNDAYNL